jgi:hypothetical protein
MNLLGKPSGFLGYRGNRESRAPLGDFLKFGNQNLGFDNPMAV